MDRPDLSANLEYYKFFYYVVQCGSFTAAAKRLCLTQPSVTTAVKKLEGQLNCTLFTRGKQGAELTPEGQMLWERVEPACQLLLTAEQELAAVPLLEGGTLSISATEMGFITYVLPALERFTQDYPNIRIRFLGITDRNPAAMLREGDVDLILLHTPFRSDSQLNIREIGTIHECFVTGRRYRNLSEQSRTLEELARYPFVSVPESAHTFRFTTALFAQHGLVYKPDIEVTTIELVVRAVLHNFGIAMLPLEHVQRYLDSGDLFQIPVEEAALTRTACVLTHRDLPLRTAAQVFLDDYLIPAP